MILKILFWSAVALHRPWLPILISFLFYPSLFLVLGRSFFTARVFLVEISLPFLEIKLVTYRIAQNFGGRKHWRIWRLGANSPKFYPPKFSITLVFYHCSTQSANVFSAKYILGANPPKFSTAKVLCYTVYVANCPSKTRATPVAIAWYTLLVYILIRFNKIVSILLDKISSSVISPQGSLKKHSPDHQ